MWVSPTYLTRNRSQLYLSFPQPLPADTRVPAWAYADVSVSLYFIGVLLRLLRTLARSPMTSVSLQHKIWQVSVAFLRMSFLSRPLTNNQIDRNPLALQLRQGHPLPVLLAPVQVAFSPQPHALQAVPVSPVQATLLTLAQMLEQSLEALLAVSLVWL